MLFVGIDLAWSDGGGSRRPRETGAVIVDAQGDVLHADWTVGVADTVRWVEERIPRHTGSLIFVDAPLVVNNHVGQRTCETQIGQRYGRWKVSANSTNTGSKHLAGVELRQRLTTLGWCYSDGCAGPPQEGRNLSECYPYTAIVGVEELGYGKERPRYKRRPKGITPSEFRLIRARECDELIRRINRIPSTASPLNLQSHPATRSLTKNSSPLQDAEYKHREDLLDAVICAWTALIWASWGRERCQVLGCDESAPDGLRATIVAPARAEQRRPGVGMGTRK